MTLQAYIKFNIMKLKADQLRAPTTRPILMTCLRKIASVYKYYNKNGTYSPSTINITNLFEQLWRNYIYKRHLKYELSKPYILDWKLKG